MPLLSRRARRQRQAQARAAQQKEQEAAAVSTPKTDIEDEDDDDDDDWESSIEADLQRERQSVQSYMTDEAYDDDDVDGGDLPTLKKTSAEGPSMGGRWINGQVTTTRPLSPPSSAGMAPPAPRVQVRNEYEEDMPDDEWQAVKSKSSKEDEESRFVVEDTSTNDDPYLMDLPTNLCDTALNLCGISEPTPVPRSLPPSRPRKKLTLGDPAELEDLQEGHRMPVGVDEQTAIEVEYVDPYLHLPARVPPDPTLTPQARNAYLDALAARAQDDYHRKSPVTTGPLEDEDEDETPAENVYSTFTPAEKRKFLKLINSGKTPSESTKQILHDREQQPAAPVPLPATASRESSARSTPEPAEFEASGIQYYDAVRKERNQSTDEDDDEQDGDRKSEVSTASSRGSRSRNLLGRLLRRKDFAKLSPNDQDEDVEDDDDNNLHKNPVQMPTKIYGHEESAPRQLSADEAEEKKSEDESAAGAPMSGAAALASIGGDEDAAPFVDDSEEVFGNEDDNDEDSLEGYLNGHQRPSAPVDLDKTIESDEPPPPPPDADEDEQPYEEEEDAMMYEDNEEEAHEDGETSQVQLDNDMEVDLDAYVEDATSRLTTNYGATAEDHVSVVSGKSYKTTGTNATVSTRTRRPGAAKERLNVTKKAQHKKTGWHESMKAAAAKSNRVWDPKRGWIDYRDPSTMLTEDDVSAPPRAGEKIHLALPPRSRGVASEEGPESSGSAVPVPFPSEWERQRQEMLHSGSAQEQAPPRAVQRGETSAPPPQRLHKAPPSHDQRKQAAARPPPSPPVHERSAVHNQGWVESMKAATAKLGAKNGKRWDPEMGWVSATTPEQQEPSESVAKVIPPPIPTRSIPVESDVQNFGMASNEPTGQPLSLQITGQSSKSYDSRGELDPETAVVRYIQLGDTGSVRSHYQQHQPNASTKRMQQNRAFAGTPENEVASFNQSSAFSPTNARATESPKQPTSDSMYNTPDSKAVFAELDGASRGKSAGSEAAAHSARGSMVVDVVKQKIGADDANLFQADSKKKNDSFDSFDNNTDFSWDNDSFPSGKSGSQAKQQQRSKQRSPAIGAKSFDSASSTGARSIPKLRGPKRDTSPIRKANTPSPRPSSTGSFSNPAVVSPEADHISNSSKPKPSSGTALQRAVTPENTPGKSPIPKSPASNNSVVKLRTQQWELRATNSTEEAEKLEPEIAEVAGHANWASKVGSKQNLDARKSGVEESVFDLSGITQGSRLRNDRAKDEEFEALSDISPIRARDEYDEEATVKSESTTGQPDVNSSFFKRLQACAGPMLPQPAKLDGANCSSIPMAHLNFLRKNPPADSSEEQGASQSKFLPPGLCGRPDVIVEEDENETDDDEIVERKVEDSRKNNPRSSSRSNHRSGSPRKSDISSVISEEFGGKTAYLEKVAMKVALSSGRKSKRRSTGSTVSTSSSNHSEKWQKFLEKKSASGASPAGSRVDDERLSQAAERYASGKVNEMMDRMRSQSNPRERPGDAIGAFPSTEDAAEDLAAARVEAMMSSISQNREEEAEI